ncbi:MAG: C_GCAxxG_C_C family protein [Candidatus Lokiarchaeota archaeon]|nr:C_GCAxxG_C_C family protein [Candidatus Lokiarchaeota archaeon]
MSKVEEAISYFKDKYNCAQSILGPFCVQYGLDKNTALKLATGFGGGMAGFGRTCGVVSGAYMVIGLKHGMGIKDDIKLKEKTYQLIQEFSRRFTDIHDSVICRELLGCDIGTTEGKQFYSQNELFEKNCLQYVKNAVEILEDIL